MASAATPDVKAIHWHADRARQLAHVIALACRGAECEGVVTAKNAGRDHAAVVADLISIGTVSALLEERILDLEEALEGSFPDTFANP